MPVTKSAKRALRGSKAKEAVNKIVVSRLEVAVRQAKRSKGAEKILKAASLTDRAVKKGVIHKNKAARLKSQLAKLMPKSLASKAKKKTASKK